MGQTFRGSDRDSWRNRKKNTKKHANRNGIENGKFIEKTRATRFDNTRQADDDGYEDDEDNHR